MGSYKNAKYTKKETTSPKLIIPIRTNTPPMNNNNTEPIWVISSCNGPYNVDNLITFSFAIKNCLLISKYFLISYFSLPKALTTRTPVTFS